MPLDMLDHYSIRTTKLEETKEFYEIVLGLTVGDRPDLGFPGYWLYVGNQPVVHLIGINEDDPQELVDYLGDADTDTLVGGGAVDHLAFRASDAPALKKQLDDEKVEYRERNIPELKLFQLFLEDPNEVTVELNYYR